MEHSHWLYTYALETHEASERAGRVTSYYQDLLKWNKYHQKKKKKECWFKSSIELDLATSELHI